MQLSSTNVIKVDFRDGDTLEVYTISDDLSTDEGEDWIAHLDATEEKISLLKTELDSKRAELEAAIEQNDLVTATISEIHSTVYRLRQDMLIRSPQ
jgi:hypothetical protein